MAFNGLRKKMAQGTPPMAPPPSPMPGQGVQPALGPSPAAGMDPMSQGAAQPAEAPQKFTLGTLIDAINQNPDQMMEMLRHSLADSDVESDGQPTDVLSLLEPENWRDSDDDKRGQVAGLIMKALPQEMRAEAPMNTDNGTVPAIPAKIEASVQASNEAIKKLAQTFATSSTKTASKGYNSLKVAHQTAVDTVLFGPNTTRVFPSVNQVGNDWHVTERNKGWGLKVDEMYGIDYEMFWRQNIMDKYYRDYRDKDGNWVGGYLRKRFETDRNVPDQNNIQLKPGELRKPYLPQYRSLEARLEQQRVDNKVPGAKVYNWSKQARSEALIKTTGSLPKCPKCGHSILRPGDKVCYDCKKFNMDASASSDQKKK